MIGVQFTVVAVMAGGVTGAGWLASLQQRLSSRFLQLAGNSWSMRMGCSASTADANAGQLVIQMSVPYRIRAEPSSDGRGLVFAERIRHQVVTTYVIAGTMSVGVVLSFFALLTGYPNPLVPLAGIAICTVAALGMARKASTLHARELRVDPRKGICVLASNGQLPSQFSVADAELRVVEVSKRGGPVWGYAVVVVAAETHFPLAAVKQLESAKQYIASLPRFLQDRIVPGASTVQVERLAPRGWGD